MGKMGAFVIGLVAVVIAIAAVFYMQRGDHLELTGSILKVRTAELEAGSSVVVLDFRIDNPTDIRFQVRNVEITMVAEGKTFETIPVGESDAKTLFAAYPVLGAKYNTTLLMRDTIKPRSTEDRMAAARIDLPFKQVEARSKFIMRIEDVDGTVATFETNKK